MATGLSLADSFERSRAWSPLPPLKAGLRERYPGVSRGKFSPGCLSPEPTKEFARSVCKTITFLSLTLTDEKIIIKHPAAARRGDTLGRTNMDGRVFLIENRTFIVLVERRGVNRQDVTSRSRSYDANIDESEVNLIEHRPAPVNVITREKRV